MLPFPIFITYAASPNIYPRNAARHLSMPMYSPDWIIAPIGVKTRGGIIEPPSPKRRCSKKEKLLMISAPEKISIQSHSARKGSLGLPASSP